MTFNLIYEDVKEFENLISIVQSIIPEGFLTITKEGISIRALDVTRIAMVDFLLKASAFKKYGVTEDMNIGLSIVDFYSFIKSSKKNETLQLSFDEDTKNLLIRLITEKTKRTFSMRLLDLPDENIPSSVSMDFQSSFTIKSEFINQILKDARLIDDYLHITVKPEEVFFSNRSDTKEMKAEISQDSEDLTNIKCDDKVIATFSLDYLEKFIRPIKSNNLIDIELSNDNPIKMVYTLDGEKGYLVYLVAPRIETSEDISDD